MKLKFEFKRIQAEWGCILTSDSITFKKRTWVSYVAVMELLQLSLHEHALERRKAKYPSHFVMVHDNWWISPEYAVFIIYQYQVHLEGSALKGKGGVV